MAVYDQSGALKEMPIYGSQRIGMVKALDTDGQFTHGNRQYEYSNHLGNVLAVSTDKMTTVGEHGDLISASNYYPFGLRIDDRSMNSGDYRYGFNGKEIDDEWNSESYNFDARIYNSGIGRFLSLDPLAREYPDINDYHFVRNSPIFKIDPTGKWDVEVHVFNDRSKYGYGMLIVKNNQGDIISQYKVRVEGSNHSLNQYNKRNRLLPNADTPLGVYNIDGWISGTQVGEINNDNRLRYGPNDRLSLSAVEGEIAESGRSLIRVHGGRQESRTIIFAQDEKGNDILDSEGDKIVVSIIYNQLPNAHLSATYGCIRIMDNDIQEFKNTIDKLQIMDKNESPGQLKVIDDVQQYGGNYFLPTDFSTIIESDKQIKEVEKNKSYLGNRNSTSRKESVNRYNKQKALDRKID